MMKKLRTIAVIAAVMALVMMPLQTAMAAGNYVQYNGVKVYYGSNARSTPRTVESKLYIIG